MNNISKLSDEAQEAYKLVKSWGLYGFRFFNTLIDLPEDEQIKRIMHQNELVKLQIVINKWWPKWLESERNRLWSNDDGTAESNIN